MGEEQKVVCYVKIEQKKKLVLAMKTYVLNDLNKYENIFVNRK